uniref:Aspartate dehydrogenase domain-containing protein n=1 Tax=Strigamia maritima TaxID=126957 RepID=T1J5E0_STRMM
MSKRRVGIVGFGHLGQFLATNLQENPNFELVFVWNRNPEALIGKIPSSLILRNLENLNTRKPDLIVEVAHPYISSKYGEFFLQQADYLMGSPTALADPEVEIKLREAANGNHGLYVPSGAFWGGEDIWRMADRNTLRGLKVTMTKCPQSFKLEGYLKKINDDVESEAITLYNGPVRDLCPLAPNNVNTMAAAAIAGYTLGFDGVIGCLVSDPNLRNFHVVEIEVTGLKSSNDENFTVHTIRKNPATLGHVTGEATFAAFVSSVISAHSKGPGIHLC